MIKAIRYKNNPILKPYYWWESNGVFNPAITEYNNNFYMLYRGQGDDGVSRLGLAISKDGIKFKRTSKYPIIDVDTSNKYSNNGLEDPRIAKIDDTYYITHTLASECPEGSDEAYCGPDGNRWIIRIGLTTTTDWKTFNYRGIILKDLNSKNATFFPSKFNDEYALLHRVDKHINLSFSKDFTNFEKGRSVMVSDSVDWQELRIGICSAPIDLNIGWLSTFHGVDKNRKYRLGLVLFDKNNPRKILYRSYEPIMSPYEEYERSGTVKDVIFGTGMIKKSETIYIYYGAADTVIGVATIDANLLEEELNRYLGK